MVTLYGSSVCENVTERVDVWVLWNEWGNAHGKKYFGRVMTSVYFGTVYQIETPAGVPPITNFRLPDGTKPATTFFTGIPMVVAFGINRNDTVGMYESVAGDDTQFFTRDTTLTVVGIQMYTDFIIEDGRKYFSTLKNGNIFSDAVAGTAGTEGTPGTPAVVVGGITIIPAIPGIPGIPGIPDTPAIIVNPPDAYKYYVYSYFTSLNHANVNLNNSTTVTLGWSSSDVSGSYGADTALVRMYKSDGTLQAGPLSITNDTDIPITLLSTIPSGSYYYTYDFASQRIAAIVAEGYTINYTFGTNAEETTSTFTFITQFLQSVSATTITPGGTSTISINVGVGYKGNSYILSINDSNNFSQRIFNFAVSPYTYTPPPTVNTRTYIATVSNSSDTNDTTTRTAEFISYQYVANLAISIRILQSANNSLTWTGGSAMEQFQYGTTAITTNGSTTFTSGNKVDSSGFIAGTAYAIQPTNTNENSGSYAPFYFDSIAPNQQIQISNNSILQTYRLKWNAYYTAASPAPDGTRQYQVTFTGNGSVYVGTSTYNVLTIPYSAVTFGIPYSIQVEDITVATNIYFFDTPTNFDITPNKINFENTLSWTSSGNPVFNVRMGNYVFQSSSPYTYNFTEDIIDPVGDVSFWPLGSSESSAIITDSYFLNENTIYVPLSASIPVFSGVFFSFDIGSVLYRNDTFSLSLYRNGLVVQELEAIVSNPFTWFPYNYVVTYQPGDQLYVKSNEHLNYGVSVPFTFIVNATVALDSVYTIFSAIVATMTIDADVAFTARLRGPVTIPVTFTQQGKQYTIQLNQYSIPLGTYQLDFILVNSPTIIVTSPTFIVTTTVTVDQSEYTIISTVNATLYVGVPTTFTVALQDVDQLFPPIALPSFTANMLSTYSFKLYGLPVTDANYVLQFTSGAVVTSPVFAVSTSYFSLEKPVVPIPPSRATSNTLCVTAKKNNVPTTIISIMNSIVYPKAIRGQPQFLVPCGILPHVKELTELLKTLPLRAALIFLIQKYDIPQSTPAITNQKRYQLPTANSKVLNPILQFTSSFRLSSKIPGNSVPISTFFVQKLTDARVLTLCNDDTKTFSATYTDMLKNATYWFYPNCMRFCWYLSRVRPKLNRRYVET